MSADQEERFVTATKNMCKQWRNDLDLANKSGKLLWLLTHPYLGLDPNIGSQYLRAKADYIPIPRNITLYDKDVLFAPGTIALFTIRNPYLWVPSVYRVTSANARAWAKPGVASGLGEYYLAANLLWSRQLYEYYNSQEYHTVVVDADDFLNSSEYVMHLASFIHMEPVDCIFQWERMTEEAQEQLPGMLRYVQSTLLNSEGVIREKAANDLNAEEEKLKWIAEFGDDAGLIQELVDLALPHYEYMYARRLKLPK